MKHYSYYFNVAILTPKIKFWLIGFSKIFKPRLKQTFAFRKSLSRFSNNLSLRTPVKILTLKKIKSKVFFKNFILNLLENNAWVSFSHIDISNFELWNFTKLKKKIASFLNKYDFNYEIILTTKFTNKIFKNFIYKTSNNFKHPTYFSEKYFNTEKYSRSVSISNNLKILLLKFFSFFLTSNLAIKQTQILLNKKLNLNFLDNLLNYKNLFLSNWIFVFLKLKSDFNDQIYFNFLNEIFNNIKLFECYSFFNGFLTFYSNQRFNTLIESNFFNKKDNNFINFFINYTNLTKKTILSFNNLESIKINWKKKNMLNQLINTLLHLFSINFKINLFFLIILLLQMRLNPFISKFFISKFFLLKCQPLHN